MGDAKAPEEGPSLELPPLFRRRRKKVAEPVADTPSEPTPEPTPDEPRASSNGSAPVEVDDEPSVVLPETVPEPEPTPAPEPTAVPEPEPEPEPAPEPVDEEPTQVVAPPPAEEPVEPPRVERVEPPPVASTGAEQPEPVAEPKDERRPVRPIEPRTRDAEPRKPAVPVADRVRDAVPALTPGAAASVVGAVVGLLGCVVTWIGLQGCEVVTGAQTCGGPGLLILIVILVGQILLGAALLRMFGVPEAGNLSFLGVGIMVVITLMLLIDHLYEAWMFAAIPVVTALAFAVARWITTRYVDDTDDYPAEQHDIR